MKVYAWFSTVEGGFFQNASSFLARPVGCPTGRAHDQPARMSVQSASKSIDVGPIHITPRLSQRLVPPKHKLALPFYWNFAFIDKQTCHSHASCPIFFGNAPAQKNGSSKRGIDESSTCHVYWGEGKGRASALVYYYQ